MEPGVREPARGTKVECELKRSLDGRAERYASPQVADAQREDVESSNCLLATSMCTGKFLARGLMLHEKI